MVAGIFILVSIRFRRGIVLLYDADLIIIYVIRIFYHVNIVLSCSINPLSCRSASIEALRV